MGRLCDIIYVSTLPPFIFEKCLERTYCTADQNARGAYEDHISLFRPILKDLAKYE